MTLKWRTEFKRHKWNLLAKNEYFPVSLKKKTKHKKQTKQNKTK